MSTDLALPLPIEPQPGMDPDRRTWLLATTAMGAAGAAAVAVPLVSSFAPSERAKAQGASVTMDPASVAPGEVKVVEWRGQPVWVMRRTPAMLATLENMPDLADAHSEKKQQPPYATNTHRSIKPELLVAVGICTHLGCSPNVVAQGSNNPSVPPDWKGGFFCPCHGSTFDLAGRVFKNKPAPTNLLVPPHTYQTDGTLLIGEDGSDSA
jgi:ubiquinol-cytochrome c reductase iron-sulfur subunit